MWRGGSVKTAGVVLLVVVCTAWASTCKLPDTVEGIIGSPSYKALQKELDSRSTLTTPPNPLLVLAGATNDLLGLYDTVGGVCTVVAVDRYVGIIDGYREYKESFYFYKSPEKFYYSMMEDKRIDTGSTGTDNTIILYNTGDKAVEGSYTEYLTELGFNSDNTTGTDSNTADTEKNTTGKNNNIGGDGEAIPSSLYDGSLVGELKLSNVSLKKLLENSEERRRAREGALSFVFNPDDKLIVNRKVFYNSLDASLRRHSVTGDNIRRNAMREKNMVYVLAQYAPAASSDAIAKRDTKEALMVYLFYKSNKEGGTQPPPPPAAEDAAKSAVHGPRPLRVNLSNFSGEINPQTTIQELNQLRHHLAVCVNKQAYALASAQYTGEKQENKNSILLSFKNTGSLHRADRLKKRDCGNIHNRYKRHLNGVELSEDSWQVVDYVLPADDSKERALRLKRSRPYPVPLVMALEIECVQVCRADRSSTKCDECIKKLTDAHV